MTKKIASVLTMIAFALGGVALSTEVAEARGFHRPFPSKVTVDRGFHRPAPKVKDRGFSRPFPARPARGFGRSL